MTEKFLAKYFSLYKTAKLRNNIYKFEQFETESLYKASDNFKELLCRCLHHSIEIWEQVHIFYNGINRETLVMFDIVIGETFIKKRSHEAFEQLEKMASKNYNWQTVRSIARRLARLH